jgi:Rho GTPase-activating protein 1
MKGRAPPPGIQRASSEVWGANGRGKVVEELRALYEERARGVEVLVRNGPTKGQGRGRKL